MLFGDLAHDGSGSSSEALFSALIATACRSGLDHRSCYWRRSRCCRCFGRGGRSSSRCGDGRASVRLDVGHNRADFDGLAFRDNNLNEGAGCRRRDLCINLVGRDLQDRLVTLDGVANLLHPLRNCALGNGLAHLGHRNFNTSHARSLPFIVICYVPIFMAQSEISQQP